MTGRLGWQCCLYLVSSASVSSFSHSWITESPTCSFSQSCSLPIQMETESMSAAILSFSTSSCTPRFMTPLQTWLSHTCRIPNIALYPLITPRPLGAPGARPAIRFLQVTAHLLSSSCPARTRLLLFPGRRTQGFTALPYPGWPLLLCGKFDPRTQPSGWGPTPQRELCKVVTSP